MNQRILNKGVIARRPEGPTKQSMRIDCFATSWLAMTTKLIGVIFFLICVICVNSFSAEPKLVASNYSDRYHWSTCKIAQKIYPEELIIFKTPEEAFDAGYIPCKKCNPPVPKGKENTAKYNFQKKTKDDPDTES